MINDTLLKMFLAVFSIVISLFLGNITKNMQDLKTRTTNYSKGISNKDSRGQTKKR